MQKQPAYTEVAPDLPDSLEALMGQIVDFTNGDVSHGFAVFEAMCERDPVLSEVVFRWVVSDLAASQELRDYLREFGGGKLRAFIDKCERALKEAEAA